ncbi:COG3014 family protein [Peijinzhouia sedimentorum]
MKAWKKVAALLMMLMLLVFTSSCATFYQRYQAFNSKFEQGQLFTADQALANDKKLREGRARLLYFLNRGAVNSILGNYELSNELFEEAYLMVEDYQTDYLQEALALVSNPNVITYKGELHEVLLIHYYKSLNYLKLGNYEAALVESRRLNLKLQEASDKINSDKKYKRDAFSHLMMGISYDASEDYNNAFIAYRNAVDIYLDDYSELFNVQVPNQLKQDLLHMAALNGFDDEKERYERILGVKYQPRKVGDGGQMVFFWNNGLGPVKSEWSINFAVVEGAGGYVNFTNEQYGWDFPFYLDNNVDEEEKNGLAALSVIRVAFPKYVERSTVFESAVLNGALGSAELDKVSDINAIAFKVLEQRMVAEFGKALLRVALKKVAEQQMKKEDKNIGAIIGLINAASEKADTRNWQSLPHSVYYSRLPLQQGENEIEFNTKAVNGRNQKHIIKAFGTSGETYFHSFHSLEHQNKMPSYFQ